MHTTGARPGKLLAMAFMHLLCRVAAPFDFMSACGGREEGIPDMTLASQSFGFQGQRATLYSQSSNLPSHSQMRASKGFCSG